MGSKCISCLDEVDLATFLRNDHVCDRCNDLPPAEAFRYRSNTDEQTAAIAAMEAQPPAAE
jgi:hypothetical protein